MRVYQQRDTQALAVAIAAPPYDSFGACVDLRGVDATNLAPGTVFGLELNNALPDDDALIRATQAARKLCPAVPLVLRIHGSLDPEAVRLIQRAAQLHVRAVVVDREPLADAMRRCLTAPLDLAADVVAWLAIRLPMLPLHVADLCRIIFRYASVETTIDELLASAGESARSARARFRKLCLPAPGSWYHVARAIHAALSLQRAPQAPLFGLAIELGYCDHSALSHQFVRLFGLRASQVRRLLGWEWLLDSWLTRQAAMPSPV